MRRPPVAYRGDPLCTTTLSGRHHLQTLTQYFPSCNLCLAQLYFRRYSQYRREKNPSRVCETNGPDLELALLLFPLEISAS